MKRLDLKRRLRRDLTAFADRVAPDQARAWDRMIEIIETEPEGPVMEVLNMAEKTTENMTETRLGHRSLSHSKLSLGLAVAAVILVALVLGSMIDRGREIADLGTASDGADLTTEERFVASMVDAFNDADMSRWRAHFAPGANVFGADIDIESNADYYAGFMALQHRLVLKGGCESLLDATSRSRVRCPIDQSDRFHRTGGLEISDTVTFNFEDGLISRMSYDGTSTTRSTSYFTEYLEMDIDYQLWLDAEHPDTSAILSDTETSLVEAGEIFVRYVDDFVAQSDEYPVP